MGRSESYTSPAKRTRNMSRMIHFLKHKLQQASPKIPNLSIYNLSPISIQPKPKQMKFSVTSIQTTSILPQPKQMKLSVMSVQSTSIPPKPVYHPAIIRACLSMFDKKPDSLNTEETEKFSWYRNWKSQKGEPIEQEILYNPAGGNKNCLHCELPT